MNKQERVTFVINKLKELYPTIPVPLDHKDPYTLLIAVLLTFNSSANSLMVLSLIVLTPFVQHIGFVSVSVACFC